MPQKGSSLVIILLIATFSLLQIHLTLFTKYQIGLVVKELGNFYRQENITSNIQLPSKVYTMKTSFPDVVIYRRTQKTGSCSMVRPLRQNLRTYKYINVFLDSSEARLFSRAASVSNAQQRFFVSSHNNLDRSDFRRKSVIILDTFRDGYKQITSYCRHIQNVKSCDINLKNCLLNSSTLNINKYRWAGREQEDDNTYIDIPLSSAHPHLSTKALRTVFPNVSLNLGKRLNVQNTTCPEIPSLRSIYNKHYSKLEDQIIDLKKRFLIVTGYPYKFNGSESDTLLDDLLNSAERIETENYRLVSTLPLKERQLDETGFKGYISKTTKWVFDYDGNYSIMRIPE